MIKVNDEIELTIEKLTYKGLSLARHYEDEKGFVVFVKGGAPEDKVKAKITKVNKNYATGDIVEIIKPSKYRVKPFCPLFNACGGCCFQYVDYDFLLEQKNNMLKEAFLQLDYVVEFKEPKKSVKDKQYRLKVQSR